MTQKICIYTHPENLDLEFAVVAERDVGHTGGAEPVDGARAVGTVEVEVRRPVFACRAIGKEAGKLMGSVGRPGRPGQPYIHNNKFPQSPSHASGHAGRRLFCRGGTKKGNVPRIFVRVDMPSIFT